MRLLPAANHCAELLDFSMLCLVRFVSLSDFQARLALVSFWVKGVLVGQLSAHVRPSRECFLDRYGLQGCVGPCNLNLRRNFVLIRLAEARLSRDCHLDSCGSPQTANHRGLCIYLLTDHSSHGHSFLIWRIAAHRNGIFWSNQLTHALNRLVF